MTAAPDLLAPILERKRRENARRVAHLQRFDPRLPADARLEDKGARALSALRRDGAELPRVIAELKHRSPSEGVIRRWAPGDGVRVAEAYAEAGAAAVSVLCDGAGFGGSVLSLRRVARAVDRPVLFKEFVLDELQVDLARAAGASMVLLLVRALSDASLRALTRACRDRGMEALVEAADEAEVERAVSCGARIVGVNARDLSTFRVSPRLAARAIQKVPKEHVAVYMSGVHGADDLRRVARTRADAVLIGTALMRAPDPGARLAEMIAGEGGA